MIKNSLVTILIVLMFSGSIFIQAKNGYKLVWQDNFKTTYIDTTAWTHEVAKPGWVNNEKQRYTNGKNVEQKNGKLILTARYEDNEYTSARLITENKRIFTYGYVEIKAKLPAGIGTWPALWMLGNNHDQVGWPACGELDIMEHVGRNPGVVFSSIHNTSGYGNTPYSGKISILQPYEKFHIYAMEWTAEFITFFVDGREIYHYNPAIKTPENWPFNKPCYFIFNIAIGGNLGGKVDNSIFPTTMIIDWIKMYQKK